MSTLFQWNGSITYSFEIERDFGTDYGICCWHTPQHNISLIHQDMIEHNHSEVHWGEWFMGVKKVSCSVLPLLSSSVISSAKDTRGHRQLRLSRKSIIKTTLLHILICTAQFVSFKRSSEVFRHFLLNFWWNPEAYRMISDCAEFRRIGDNQ